MKKPLVALALAAASVLVLSGCSTGTAPAAADGKVSVVATTNVYGDLAATIGGDRVSVTSLIDSLSQDPHSYEATARDRLAVRSAALVIENGGGYDPFMEDLLDGAKTPVISAVEFNHDYPGNTGHTDHADEHGSTPAPTASADDHAGATPDHADEHAGHDHIEGFNEHVWFDPHTMIHLVEDIAHHLTELDPKGEKQYTDGAASLTASLKDAEAQLAQIKEKAAGAGVFLTEPVPGYLAAAAGLTDRAPEGFATAVEEGTDVPPATLLAAIDVIKSGTVRAVLANEQTAGAETARVEQEAKAQNVAVVQFTEILPAGKSYSEWMRDAIDSLARAVGA